MHSKTRVDLMLELSEDMQDKNFVFSILHIRDGKDQMDAKETLVNTIHTFEKVDDAHLKATIEYDKNLGFQFKCFADIIESELSDAELIAFFESEGFEDVSKDGGLERFWFILGDYGTVDTIDGFINNYYYPF